MTELVRSGKRKGDEDHPNIIAKREKVVDGRVQQVKDNNSLSISASSSSTSSPHTFAVPALPLRKPLQPLVTRSLAPTPSQPNIQTQHFNVDERVTRFRKDGDAAMESKQYGSAISHYCDGLIFARSLGHKSDLYERLINALEKTKNVELIFPVFKNLFNYLTNLEKTNFLDSWQKIVLFCYRDVSKAVSMVSNALEILDKSLLRGYFFGSALPKLFSAELCKELLKTLGERLTSLEKAGLYHRQATLCQTKVNSSEYKALYNEAITLYGVALSSATDPVRLDILNKLKAFLQEIYTMGKIPIDSVLPSLEQYLTPLEMEMLKACHEEIFRNFDEATICYYKALKIKDKQSEQEIFRGLVHCLGGSEKPETIRNTIDSGSYLSNMYYQLVLYNLQAGRCLSFKCFKEAVVTYSKMLNLRHFNLKLDSDQMKSFGKELENSLFYRFVQALIGVENIDDVEEIVKNTQLTLLEREVVDRLFDYKRGEFKKFVNWYSKADLTKIDVKSKHVIFIVLVKSIKQSKDEIDLTRLVQIASKPIEKYVLEGLSSFKNGRYEPSIRSFTLALRCGDQELRAFIFSYLLKALEMNKGFEIIEELLKDGDFTHSLNDDERISLLKLQGALYESSNAFDNALGCYMEVSVLERGYDRSKKANLTDVLRLSSKMNQSS